METRDLRTWGLGDLGTCGRGEFGTWRLGDLGTWGLGDLGTWGHGDFGTWRLGDLVTWAPGQGTWELGDVADLGASGLGDLGTWGLRDLETWGRGDLGTWGLGDLGTWGHGDLRTWGLGDWETHKPCGQAHGRISAVNGLASMPTMRARRMARLTHGAGCSQNAWGPLPRNKSFVRTLLPRSPAHGAPGIFSNPVSGSFPGRDLFFYWFFTRDLFRSTFKNIILYN